MLVYAIRKEDLPTVGECSRCGDKTTLQYMETFNDDGFVTAGDYCSPVCALKAGKAKIEWTTRFYSNNH